MTNSVFNARVSCYPCMQGFHEGCRHNPNDDGSVYVYPDDDRTKQGRWALFKDRYQREEIPRPPCQCEANEHTEDGTCGDMRITDFGSYFRCGRPVKGTIALGSFGVQAEVQRCGIHLAAIRKRRANDAKRQAEWDARKQKTADEDAATKASHDWAERIAREFGLPVEGMSSSAGSPRVKMHPEKAYAILDEVRSKLDEVYGNDHPFATVRDV